MPPTAAPRGAVFLSVLSLILLAGCASNQPGPVATAAEPTPSAAGVIVMAHGGDPGWNTAIEAAVEPIRAHYPTAVAFGMADRATLADAIGKLEERGVRHIAVVRLFVSGESFLDQTEYLLGLSDAPPAHPMHHGTPGPDANTPIPHRARLVLSADGLAESSLIGQILANRVRDLSRDPARESVLLLAHGMGDDAANDRLLDNLGRRAVQVQAKGPYRTVRVEALREDWAEDREVAERRIRAFVERARADGGIAIVVPVRVSGFGPYARVLDGYVYRHDGRGLSPHPLLSDWIKEQADKALRSISD